MNWLWPRQPNQETNASIRAGRVLHWASLVVAIPVALLVIPFSVGVGEGVLIVEEAPLAGSRSGEVRLGIEGMIDAGMKVFGM